MRDDPIADADPARGLRFDPSADVIDEIIRRGPGPDPIPDPPVARRRRRAPRPRPALLAGGAVAMALVLLLATQVGWNAGGSQSGLLEEAAAAMTAPNRAFHYTYELVQFGTTTETRNVSHLKSRTDVWATSDGRYRRVEVVNRRTDARDRAAHGEYDHRHSVEIRRRDLRYTFSTRFGGAAQLEVERMTRCFVPPPLGQLDLRALVTGAAVRNGQSRILSQRVVGDHVVLRFRYVVSVPRGCRQSKPGRERAQIATVVLDRTTFLPRSAVLRTAPRGRHETVGLHLELRYTTAEHVPVDDALRRRFVPPAPGEACDPRARVHPWPGQPARRDAC